MNNDKLVLKDGTEITLESSQGIGALHVLTDSKDAVCTLWKKFTKENLGQVTVKNSDGLIVGRYSDMVLDHIEATDNEDGSVLATFSLREKSKDEIVDERLSAMETSQRTQDEAIGDMGQAISDIMEGGMQ